MINYTFEKFKALRKRYRKSQKRKAMETATTTVKQLTQKDLPEGFVQWLGDYFEEHADWEGRTISVENKDYFYDFGEDDFYIKFWVEAYVQRGCDWDTGSEWTTITDIEGYIAFHKMDEEDGTPFEEPFAEMEVTGKNFHL